MLKTQRPVKLASELACSLRAYRRARRQARHHDDPEDPETRTWTLQEVAARIPCSFSVLSRWESLDRYPNHDQLVAWAAALDLTLEVTLDVPVVPAPILAPEVTHDR